VIKDAACGFVGKRDGRFAGTEALAGCFSFQPRKAITTGEGGMVVTNDERLADKVRKMRDHGGSKTDLERHLEEGGSLLPGYNMLGFNYRMTDLQGALGVVQMDKADMILKGRKEAASRYDSLLQGIDEIKRPSIPEGYSHAYQSYVCVYKADSNKLKDKTDIDWPKIETWNQERNRIMAKMEGEGISVSQGTHTVHALGYYKKKYGLNDHDYPMSYMADRLSITLPLYCEISEQEQARVVASLKSLLNR